MKIELDVTDEEGRRILNYLEWLRNPKKSSDFKKESLKNDKEEEEEEEE